MIHDAVQYFGMIRNRNRIEKNGWISRIPEREFRYVSNCQAMVKVGQNVAELSLGAPRNCMRPFHVANPCQNAVLKSLVLRKSNPAHYFHCVVCITEFPDLIDRVSCRVPQTTQSSGPSDLQFKHCSHATADIPHYYCTWFIVTVIICDS